MQGAVTVSRSALVRLTCRAATGLAVLALGLAALVSASPIASAQQPQPKLTITQLDASQYPRIRAVVTALDSNGLPVRGLDAAQFLAADGTTRVNVDGAQTEQDRALGLSVVLVIDVSGSMADNDAIGRARDAAKGFINSLGANDDAAVFAFSTGVTQIGPPGFTKDRGALTSAIEALQAGGDTVLYDAAEAGINAARSSPQPRKAIVLMTDGQDTRSQATGDDARSAARAAGVPIFTIGFGAEPDVNYLQALALDSHGTYYPADVTNVGVVYATIADLLRSQYVLSLTSPVPQDGKETTLKLTANIGGVAASDVSKAFTRGTAAVAPPPSAEVPTVAVAPAPGSTGSGVNKGLVAFAVLGAIIVAVVVALVARSVRARRRAERAARDAGRQSDEPLPDAVYVNGTALDGEDGTGRIVAVGGDTAGTAFHFGATPIAIGSDASADVRVAASTEVARRHALVWMRGGKMMLRHIGGIRRNTLVGGRSADWLILEDGDEIQVGPHRFRAEYVGPEVVAEAAGEQRTPAV